MAWVDVSGSNNTLEYENAATAANTYPDAPGVYSGGIRTFTTPGTGQVNEIYARTRLKGEINLFTNSENFTLSGWQDINSAITVDNTIAPDGSMTGNKLQQNSGQTNADLSNLRDVGLTSTSGTDYTISMYAKISANRNFLMINDHISSAFFKKTWFNLSTGIVGTVNGDHTASMVDVGNDWYRCSISLTSTITNTDSIIMFSPTETDGTPTVTDNEGSLFLWGAMLNEGPNLRRYIKTEASASTTIERGELSKDFYDATHVGF